MPNSPASAPALATPPSRTRLSRSAPAQPAEVYVVTTLGSRVSLPLNEVRWGLKNPSHQLAFALTREVRREGDVAYVRVMDHRFLEEVFEARYHGAQTVAGLLERLQGSAKDDGVRAAAAQVLRAWGAEIWTCEEPAPTLALAIDSLRREVSRG